MNELGLIRLRLRVENANTISGMTYGMPGITHFLGFTEALSRKLLKEIGGKLLGCGLICHSLETKDKKIGWDTHELCLTRNPLKKDGKTPAFVEEGKGTMEVTLLITTDFDMESVDFGTHDEMQEIKCLEALIYKLVAPMRLAGGDITRVSTVKYHEIPEEAQDRKTFDGKILRSLMPGFCLIERTSALEDHFAELRRQDDSVELLDAWLDFISLKFQADEADSSEDAVWDMVPRPLGGWVVPIHIGYKGISKLYDPGEVECARDKTVPFQYVESVHSVGAWISPHRVPKIDEIIWKYSSEGDWYLCRNENKA